LLCVVILRCNKYEFLGPNEVICILARNRFQLKKVGSYITKATEEQLRLWLVNWSLMCAMSSLLELIEADGTIENSEEAYSVITNTNYR